MKQKKFETGDLYLSSAITILLNQQPSFKVENGRTLFVFPISADLFKAISAYNSGVRLEAISFAAVIKNLASQVETIKNKDGLWDWD